ncbi:MAG TPA: ABC transporter permease subunit [Thermoanaerobaculia bacterium]|nr:ABC transporter permease subunit [Thermoanaerobaculia bacterium]
MFLHEVRLAATSFRLWAPAVLLLALMVLAAVTSAARHRGQAAEQGEIEKTYARDLAGASIGDTAESHHPAPKPPWRLALVVDGGQAATPDVYRQALSALEEPEIRRTSGENPRLPGTAPLDWMLAIRIVLSIGAFLLCHAAVCGERQAGTLKLFFSCSIPRWKILTGKFLAAWVCLAVPLLAGALASLLLAAGLGDLRPAGGDLARAALGLLLGLWAAAFFVLIALLVSSLIRDPSASLGVLALFWVAAVVVVPALSVLIARGAQPLPTGAEVNQRMIEARIQAEHEVAGQEGRWRQPRWAAVDGYAWERLSARAENRRAALQEEVRREVLDRKLRQASLARTLASLSPPSLVQDVAERLIGTGLGRDRAFLEQAWAFRSNLEKRVRQLDAADPESPNILYFRGYMSQRPLAPNALPRFVFRERTLREGLASAGPALLIFALETFLLVAATLFAFSRYDAG